MSLELKFQTGTPDVADRCMRTFIVLMVSRHNGKEYVTPMDYLNGYPLEYPEECHCASEEEHDENDGCCPTTGWFYERSNYEYENCWWKAEGEIVAWAELPNPTNVRDRLETDARKQAERAA